MQPPRRYVEDLRRHPPRWAPQGPPGVQHVDPDPWIRGYGADWVGWGRYGGYGGYGGDIRGDWVDSGIGVDESEESQQQEDGTAGVRQFARIGEPYSQVDCAKAGKDRLGYQSYADALVRVACGSAINGPFSLGLYAPWGAGKSKLLWLIWTYLMASTYAKLADSSNKKEAQQWLQSHSKDEELNDKVVQAAAKRFLGKPSEQLPAAYMPVWFNSWLYAGSENLWAGIIMEVQDALEKEYGRHYLKAELFCQSWWYIITLAVFVAALAVCCIAVIMPGMMSEAEAILAPLSAIIVGAVPIVVGISSSSLYKKTAYGVSGAASKPNFRNKVGYMVDIKNELYRIAKVLQTKKSWRRVLLCRSLETVQKRVFIVVDDLDRCKREKAVEVIESLTLLMEDQPFFVVCAIDPRIVVKAIEEQFGNIIIQAGINGFQFLDKVFQLNFLIPEMSSHDASVLIRSLAEEVKPQDVRTDAISVNIDKGASLSPSENIIGAQSGILADSTPRQASSSKEPLGNLSDLQPLTTQIPTAVQTIAVKGSFSSAELRAFEIYSHFLDRNPRRLIRIMNMYAVVRLLAQYAESDVPRGKLLKLIILFEQWPYSMAWIRQVASDRVQATQLGIINIDDEDEEVKSFLGEQCDDGVKSQDLLTKLKEHHFTDSAGAQSDVKCSSLSLLELYWLAEERIHDVTLWDTDHSSIYSDRRSLIGMDSDIELFLDFLAEKPLLTGSDVLSDDLCSKEASGLAKYIINRNIAIEERVAFQAKQRIRVEHEGGCFYTNRSLAMEFTAGSDTAKAQRAQDALNKPARLSNKSAFRTSGEKDLTLPVVDEPDESQALLGVTGSSSSFSAKDPPKRAKKSGARNINKVGGRQQSTSLSIQSGFK